MTIPLYPLRQKHEAFMREALAKLMPLEFVEGYLMDMLAYQANGSSKFFVGPTDDDPAFYIGVWINRHDVAELECTSTAPVNTYMRLVLNALCRYLADRHKVRKLRIKLWDGQEKLQRLLERAGFNREAFFKQEEYDATGQVIGVVTLSKQLL